MSASASWPFAAPAAPSTSALSKREREVLALLIDGHTHKTAAAALGLAPQTVDTLSLRARRKLSARTTLQAAVMFDRRRRDA